MGFFDKVKSILKSWVEKKSFMSLHFWLENFTRIFIANYYLKGVSMYASSFTILNNSRMQVAANMFLKSYKKQTYEKTST